MQRRPTDEALSNLRDPEIYSVSNATSWYSRGIDFCYYAPAKEACAVSRKRLEQLRLEPDEAKLLSQSTSPHTIIERLKDIQDEQEKRAHRPALAQRSSKFLEEFCTFADRTSNIVMLLIPQSPEYTVTFGMLFILFNAVVTKKEREESLLSYIKTLGSQLPLMEFYSNVFPTNGMKEAVVKIYVGIQRLLDEAVAYYRGGKLRKIVDVILHPENKFGDYIKDIELELTKLHALKEAGHIAQSADMMKMMTDTGLVVAKLYENFESQHSALSTTMEMMNMKLETLSSDTGKFLRFEMVKHARSLQEILQPHDMEFEEELKAIVHRQFRLSQKDHWENNGVLEDLFDWSQDGRDILLWIGGRSGNQDSWVTELSADIICALQPQTPNVLFAFCDQRGNAPLTPLTVIRKLLVQLLDLHPEIAYDAPEICSTWRFQKAVTFRQTWRIFEQLASRISNLFIVIDRIEECEADEEADLVHQLLPSLISWAGGNASASIIVTSVYDPPEEVQDLKMYTSYIDTTKRASRRQ
ncbi:hypothetical protein NA57DRAFT_74446 [Rhizodiscina lignyota]|uniref:NACHT domain-containing protein n=1 Tax=Rhizodiscina lignyota TaxID=1504668 RepID=A0A9P4ILX0_9PEZI|nr:hypothetical protein NA57DRAFT_74446 [Rhizodiscina lignyota]